MNENIFTPILDDNETIIKQLKPNKTRFLIVNIVVLSILLLALGLGFIIASILEYNAYSTSNESGFIPLLTIGLAFSLVFGVAIVSTVVTYQKTYYLVTNKRIIIRTGFIGADYRSLDLDSIGACDVKVDLLDKLIKPNSTGTITFGSMSMPINSNNGTVPAFAFKHINKPYDLYKEIKTIINDKKETKV